MLSPAIQILVFAKIRPGQLNCLGQEVVSRAWQHHRIISPGSLKENISVKRPVGCARISQLGQWRREFALEILRRAGLMCWALKEEPLFIDRFILNVQCLSFNICFIHFVISIALIVSLFSCWIAWRVEMLFESSIKCSKVFWRPMAVYSMEEDQVQDIVNDHPIICCMNIATPHSFQSWIVCYIMIW